MNKILKCKNCNFYKAFYIKGFFNFWLDTNGLCERCHNIIVKEGYSCDSWEPLLLPPLTIDAFDKAMADIKAIKKLFK